ncbi:MAG: hypothetical protein IT168_06825 [Bryobacterales bacterium]|nr:hypothetical protein [Bryobacterales bacterium]
MRRAVFFLVLCPVLTFAQAGLTPAWEMQQGLDALIAQTKRLVPIMEEVKAKDWIAQGASDTYAQQQQTIRNEIKYLIQTTTALKSKPDRMKDTLETYLRLQSLEALLESLSKGVRRYQNPALADLIEGLIAENDVNRGHLRTYLVELVTNKETELGIMNEEAQRCRGMLIRQAPAPPPRPKQSAAPKPQAAPPAQQE